LQQLALTKSRLNGERSDGISNLLSACVVHIDQNTVSCRPLVNTCNALRSSVAADTQFRKQL